MTLPNPDRPLFAVERHERKWYLRARDRLIGPMRSRDEACRQADNWTLWYLRYGFIPGERGLTR